MLLLLLLLLLLLWLLLLLLVGGIAEESGDLVPRPVVEMADLVLGEIGEGELALPLAGPALHVVQDLLELLAMLGRGRERGDWQHVRMSERAWHKSQLPPSPCRGPGRKPPLHLPSTLVSASPSQLLSAL